MTDRRTQLFDAIRPFAPDRRFLDSHVQTIDALADSFKLDRLDAGKRAPSPAIASFIKGFESLAKKRPDGRVEAYLPTANDVPTIGYGSTGPDITMGLVWTVAQCDARFALDLAKFGNQVSDLIGAAPTTQAQYDAMVSLAYNIGTGALKTSTLLRLHKDGDFAGAAAQFLRWDRQSGKTLAGLTKRREAEKRFYEGKGA